MDRLAPANIEAEQALLGSILIDPSAVIRVAALVTAGPAAASECRRAV